MLVLAPILVLPYYIMSERRALAISYKATQLWGHVFVFPIFGIQYQIKGQHHIPQKGSFISICNHNSYLDTPAFVWGMFRATRFLGKSELIKFPIFGYLYKHLIIPVDRSSRTSRAASIAKMRADLQMGISLLVYPEGSMNRGNAYELQPFQLGAFTLSVEEKKPILPTIIIGAEHCLNSNGLVLKPGKITVEFLPLVDSSQFDSPLEAMVHCKTIMQNHLDSISKTAKLTT